MRALIQAIAGGICFMLALAIGNLWQEVSDPATGVTAAIAAVQIALLLVVAGSVWYGTRELLKGLRNDD